MDFCNKCGGKTDPDWVYCRSCGNSLDDVDAAAAASTQTTPTIASPTVELISRGWDVVDVETVDIDAVDVLDGPRDLLDGADMAPPIAPGTVEVSVGDVTIVERSATAPGDAETVPETPGTAPADAWDHLRPHGQVPGGKDPTRMLGRAAQLLIAVASLAALVAAVLFVILNVQLERLAGGEASEQSVADLRSTAEAGLMVLAVLAALAVIALGWWVAKAYPSSRFHPGPAGIIALSAFVIGAMLVGFFSATETTTVADRLTANSLVVIGLGLIIVGGLTGVMTVQRLEIRARR